MLVPGYRAWLAVGTEVILITPFLPRMYTERERVMEGFQEEEVQG